MQGGGQRQPGSGSLLPVTREGQPGHLLIDKRVKFFASTSSPDSITLLVLSHRPLFNKWHPM